MVGRGGGSKWFGDDVDNNVLLHVSDTFIMSGPTYFYCIKIILSLLSSSI